MKLATLADGSRDGRLVVISNDASRYLKTSSITTLQQALENWQQTKNECLPLAKQLTNGEGSSSKDVQFLAPLPRAWQWLDGSAYTSHGDLLQQAFNLDPLEYDKPLMYQGMSHQFFGPTDDIPFLNEEDGIDFEGEIGVIVDDVAMGTSAQDAMSHIKLLVQINDWSLRTLAPAEMKTGFGWIQAKPACSMAPFAITPDEAGKDWHDGRLHLPLEVMWNKTLFGKPNSGAMEYGFHELIAHAAASRALCAGTIIGSGTVSNDNFREIGSTCIAEQRGIEMIDQGKMTTNFMRFGDRVEMQVRHQDKTSLFGSINQCVIKQNK